MSADSPPVGRSKRTWAERSAIAGTFIAAIVCFAVAAALIGAYSVVRNRNIAEFSNPALAAPAESPDDTFPDADPTARNFLVTGADNGIDCIDPDSHYYDAFGDRRSSGERSDTIMIIRLDPGNDRAAVLSFPRDLWVEIAGTNSRRRINSAYRLDEPQLLADTIYHNFEIPVDHFIQVDFCAFKTLVDAVGGVTIPFEYPARDRNSGFLVEAPGCVTLDGDQALAYVRSRYYQYEDEPGSGNWRSEPASDLARISRQQDFLRRLLSTLVSRDSLNPTVISGLLRTAANDIVTDADLTPARIMEFAGVMNRIDPASITTYQVEGSDRVIGGAQVLIPQLDNPNMEAVLAMFRGDTSLADAPLASPAATPDAATPAATAALGTEPSGDGSAVSEPTQTFPDQTEPAVTTVAEGPVENQVGIVPPRDVTC